MALNDEYDDDNNNKNGNGNTIIERESGALP